MKVLAQSRSEKNFTEMKFKQGATSLHRPAASLQANIPGDPGKISPQPFEDGSPVIQAPV